MSGQQLADLIGITQARVSRIETAVFRPAVPVVEAWLAATRADLDVRANLLDLAGEAQTDIAGWRAVFRGSMAARQHALSRQDAVATRVRHFQPFMIPGFLHTPEYAEAALRAARVVADADVGPAVEARLERGRRLLEAGAPPYQVLLTELALRWTPIDVTREQRKEAWRRVLEGARAPHVTLQVIPADRPMEQAPMCAFVIYDYAGDDPSTVDVELPAVELQFAGEEDVAAWSIAWERMLRSALHPDESTATIDRLLREH